MRLLLCGVVSRGHWPRVRTEACHAAVVLQCKGRMETSRPDARPLAAQ